MKTRSLLAAGAGLLGLTPGIARADKVTSDLAPPHKRQVTVDTGARLARYKAPDALPADSLSPFAPADFDKQSGTTPGTGPGAGAGGANVAAGGGGAGPAAPGAGGGPRTGAPGGGAAPTGAAVTPPAGPSGDRETLEMLANQIQPSGVLQLGNQPQLIIKSTRFKIGTKFTATYNGQDYELELVAIDRTTFTLRYRNEEITRSIRPVK